MKYRYFLLFCLCIRLQSYAATGSTQLNESQLYVGEAYFYAYQSKYIDAISRMDIRRSLSNGTDSYYPDPLHYQISDSIFTAGEFESSYRLPRRAARIINGIVESHADQIVRNEAAYRLARIILDEGNPEGALQIIDKITGKLPESVSDEELFLRAQVYMANNQFTGAVRILQKLLDENKYKGFSGYNLGVALIKIGQEKQGLEQLDKAGQVSGDDEITLAIKDKANLTIGYQLINAKTPALAKMYFERVRLSGPFSNKALLGSGWVEVTLGNFDKALAPWSELAKRDLADSSVQESMLGVPYAYDKLGLPGKATLMYGKAIDEFSRELANLDGAIKNVREGRFLHALINAKLNQNANWNAKLISSAKIPQSNYFLDLMASKDFDQTLRNYLDINDIVIKLKKWDENLTSALEHSILFNPQNDQTFGHQARQLQDRVHESLKKADPIRIKLENMLEAMAIQDLNLRRKQLLDYQIHARFALADSYERASKTQGSSSGAQ